MSLYSRIPNSTGNKVKRVIFVAFGLYPLDVKKQKECLRDIQCINNSYLYFWPKDFVSFNDNHFNVASVHTEILHNLLQNPEKIADVLEPDHSRPIEWNKENRNGELEDLLERTRKKSYGLLYLEESSTLILRIDDDIDPNGKIRNKVKLLLQRKQTQNQELQRSAYSDSLELPGDDTEPVEEDIGDLPEDYEANETTEGPPEPPYYPIQTILATQLVERIELIYNLYHDGRNLSSFDNFDFRIYTPNINMLQDQTWARLSKKHNKCLPEHLYEGSDGKARQLAKEKVLKYNQQIAGQKHNELCKRVLEEPNTLFLIVADEAHWGATDKSKANSTLVNTWTSEEHPNVIVLLVTATPYNLLTENTRISSARYIKDDNASPKLLFAEDKSKTNKSKHLHHVKWAESFSSQVKDGIVVKLRIPLQGLDKAPAQLYIIPSANDNCIPWNGYTTSYDDSKSNSEQTRLFEFLIQGDQNHVTITTVDKKWALAVRDNEVLFVAINSLNKKDISMFGILDCYGEGLILINVIGSDNRERHLVYNEYNRRIELRPQRSIKSLERFPVPPLDSSFLIDYCRPADSLVPVKQYVSLNYYLNSMRNEETSEQLIKEDLYFKEMVNVIMATDEINNIESYTMEVDEAHDMEDNEISSTMANETQNDTMKAEKTKDTANGAIVSDIFTAEYSYYILIINLLRDYPFKVKNINLCFDDMVKCAGNYPEKREYSVNSFKDILKEEQMLRNSSSCNRKIYPINPKVFESILAFLSKKVLHDFRKDLRKFERNSKERTAEELLSSVVSCLMHLNLNDLKQVQSELNGSKNCKINLTNIYANLDYTFEEIMNQIFLESETGHIIANLLEDSNKVNGNMTIVRVNRKNDGNRMYRTLCIARRISCKVDYPFEILRDYNNAKLRDDFANKLHVDNVEQSARYRIRKRLQPKNCTYIDPDTDESCDCNFKPHEKFQPSKPNLVCVRCNHVHKRIEKYTDLKGLPCILILINKGRMGDTFPQSLNVMDLRLCYRNKRILSLANIVQELGRLCRYHIISDKNPLPYALVGEHLAKKLKESLHKGAVYYTFLTLDSDVELDGKTKYKKKKEKHPNDESPEVSETIVAKDNHYDHENKKTHSNRLLLEAEPQIGKTGVYLKVISLLRHRICPDVYDEDTSKYEHMEYDVEYEDMDDESTEECQEETENISRWTFPHWQSMENGLKLKTNISTGKYPAIYGNYQYGNSPPDIFPLTNLGINNEKKKQKNPSECTKVKAYNYKEHSSCTECSAQYENEILELPLSRLNKGVMEEMNFRISVPKSAQYKELLARTRQYATNEESSPRDVKHATKCYSGSFLKTWIFIPSYGRPDKAYVNLHHTMVNKDDNYKSCQYTSVLVVRSSEFDTYYQLWQSTHAILQIPDTLPGEERDVYEGGIGFARRAIQVFAESLTLPWIFMLDDNIIYTYKIKESSSVVQRTKDGHLIEEIVPLFNVLKHIEKQIDGSVTEMPAHNFTAYRESEIYKPLEKYTGPTSKYAVIGVKKHSHTIRRTKKPFARTHVYSLVLLNIRKLTEKKIHYRPWSVFEDLTLNNDCDSKNLFVCKYNRFTIFKHHMKMWIPKVFEWTEETELLNSEEQLLAENSSNLLISWLRTTHPVQLHEEQTITLKEDGDKELEIMLRKLYEHKRNGKHQLIVIQENDYEVKNKILESTGAENFINGKNSIIIMISSDQCLKRELTTKQRIKSWLLNMLLTQSFEVDVITSHDVEAFKVKIVLIIVKVCSQSSSSTSGIQQTNGPKTLKKRPSDEHEERPKKITRTSEEEAETGTREQTNGDLKNRLAKIMEILKTKSEGDITKVEHFMDSLS